MPRLLFISILCSTFWVQASFANQSEEKPTHEPNPSSLLAEEFTRIARMATMTEPLTTNAINAAVTLATEATLLIPDDPSAWRVLFEVAQMADQKDLALQAIENLLRVEPLQPTAQLARLRDVINRAQTVDQRMSLYEQLLSESRSQELDPSVAARLALDAAFLQQQVGDINQFARWLAESVALDPSYPDAITLATGFFGDESADIYRRAELLSSAMLANIRDVTTQVALAEFLMAFGDYQDAMQLYEMILGDGASNPRLIGDNLLADIVLSQWAAGDTIAAMDTLMTRQIAVDETYRNQTKIQQPRISPLELARIHAPLVPKLAVVRAAIYANQNDRAQAEIAIDSAIGSLISLSKIYESQGPSKTLQIVELYIQAAWVSLWLSDDSEIAITLIEQVEAGAILDPQEKQRLDGWIALRQGDNVSAKANLLPLENDYASKAGLALVYLAEGNKRASALELLDIARSQGGTVLGVWARNKLQEVVGTTFLIRSEVEQLQQLMTGVLQTLNSLILDPRPPVGIEIRPIKKTFTPYFPIVIQVEITNNTTIPLTIAANGPIQPLVLVEAIIESPGEENTQFPPIVVSIDRELSIKPRAKTNIEIDLRNYWVGEILNANPLKGASISLRGTVNFSARESATRHGIPTLVYETGILGKRDSADSFRVDGVRLNDTWVKKAIEDVSEITSVQELITFVLLTWIVGDEVSVAVEEPLITPPPGEEVTPLEEGERHPLQDEAIAAVLSGFPKLSAIEQSWVIATMSDDPSIEAVIRMLKEPESTKSKLALIVRFATPFVPDEALDDPTLLDGLQSENAQVKTVALWVYDWVQAVVKKRAEQSLGAGR
jgi:hypothetical protein